MAITALLGPLPKVPAIPIWRILRPTPVIHSSIGVTRTRSLTVGGVFVFYRTDRTAALTPYFPILVDANQCEFLRPESELFRHFWKRQRDGPPLIRILSLFLASVQRQI
jgi:hypothetical protein